MSGSWDSGESLVFASFDMAAAAGERVVYYVARYIACRYSTSRGIEVLNSSVVARLAPDRSSLKN